MNEYYIKPNSHFKTFFMKGLLYKTLLFSMLIVSQAGYAQDAETTSKGYGDFRIYGGLNSTSGTGFKDFVDGAIHDHSVSGQLGYTVGISGTFGNHFYLAPGLYYSAQKTETTTTEAGNLPGAASFKGKTTINSINLPIRVGFRLLDANHSGIFNLRLFGGVVGSHVLGVSHEGDDEIKVSKDDFNDFMISTQFGFGIDILIAFVDFGYDLGMTDFYKLEGTQKSNQFFINAGVRF